MVGALADKEKITETLDRSVKKLREEQGQSTRWDKRLWEIIYKMLKLKSELVADFAKPVRNPIYVVNSEDRNLLIFAEFANLLQDDLSSLAD